MPAGMSDGVLTWLIARGFEGRGLREGADSEKKEADGVSAFGPLTLLLESG